MTSPVPEHGVTPDAIAASGVVPADFPGLEEAIESAVDAIRTYCGWHVWPSRTETLTVDGEGGRVLTLPTLHVDDIDEIREQETVVDPERYEWSRSGDVRRRGGCWTTRWRGLHVDLTHGYPSCPPALAALLADTVAEAVTNPVGAPSVIGPFQWGGQQPASSRWLSDQRTILDHYRLPEVI